MRNLLAALVGLLLALWHAWGGPACACEMDGRSTEPSSAITMDCCCDHTNAPPSDCGDHCESLRAAAPAPAPHALPDSGAGLVYPAPPVVAWLLPVSSESDSPAVSARGPPASGPPRWLKHRSLRC